jgi:hypothetical protein
MLHPFTLGNSLTSADTYFPACSHGSVRAKHGRSSPSSSFRFRSASPALAVIALWLGHSSPAVTHQYLEADLAAKEAVLRRLTDPSPAPARFRPGDRLLTFLQGL